MALEMRRLTSADAPAVVALRGANRRHFLMGEPRHDEDWFTVASQERWIADDGIALGAFDDGAAIAYARLSQIVRGGFQNCYLGYAVDERRGGRGIATDLVRFAVRLAFDDEGLHRVQANVRTDNPASRRVLAKAGFRHEGLALRYLEIDGERRDHDMFAITAEELAPPR